MDEVSGSVVDSRFGDEFLVADGDHDGAQGLKCLDDLLKRDPGLVLQVAGYARAVNTMVS